MYSGTNNGLLVRDESESAGSLQDHVYQSREGGTNDPELVINFGEAVCSNPGNQTILTTKDSWIDEVNPVANNGTTTSLRVQSRATAQNQRALVFFSLPAQPSGCRLTLSTLRLYASSAQAGRVIQASARQPAGLRAESVESHGRTSRAPQGHRWI
jgi:hypothetical protein